MPEQHGQAEIAFDAQLNRYTIAGDNAEVNEWLSTDDRARWDDRGLWVVNKGEEIGSLIDVMASDGLVLDDKRPNKGEIREAGIAHGAECSASHAGTCAEKPNAASIIATIICSLREFQEKGRHSDYCGDHFQGAARPLEPAEIDAVIEDLNFAKLTIVPQGEILRCPFVGCTEVPVSTDSGFEMSGYCCSNEDHYFQVNVAQLSGETSEASAE